MTNANDKHSGEKEGAVSRPDPVSSPGPSHVSSPGPVSSSLAPSAPASTSSNPPDNETSPRDNTSIAALAAAAAIAHAMGRPPTADAPLQSPPLQSPPLQAPNSQPVSSELKLASQAEVQAEVQAPILTPALTPAITPAPTIAAQAALAAQTLALEYTAALKGRAPPAPRSEPALAKPAQQQIENKAAVSATSEPLPSPKPELSLITPTDAIKPKQQAVVPSLAALTALAAMTRAKAYDASMASDALRAHDTFKAHDASKTFDTSKTLETVPAGKALIDAPETAAAAAGLPADDTVATAPVSVPAPPRTRLPQVSLAQLPASLNAAIAESEATTPPQTQTRFDKTEKSERIVRARVDEPGQLTALAFAPAVSAVAINPTPHPVRSAARIDTAAKFLRPPKPQTKLARPQAQSQLSPPVSGSKSQPDPVSPPQGKPPFRSTDQASTASTATATATATAATATALVQMQMPTGPVSLGRDVAAPFGADQPQQRRGAKRSTGRGESWWQGFSWLRKVFKIAALAVAGYGVLCIALIFVYRFIDPPTSNLMLWQQLTGTTPLREWVALDKISPNLIKAVIASEDARFCYHGGVDFKALRFALRQTGKRHGRGASTISMQVTKNLFLWNSRSYVRKAIEIPMTMLMEMIWPKWRVLEVYLNIAEWGEGVFGAQAAAAYHFSKPARRLSPRQAALLVVLLPNPVAREAGDPSRATRRRAARIEKRVRGSANAANCVLN